MQLNSALLFSAICLTLIIGCGGRPSGPPVGQSVSPELRDSELAALSGTWDYTRHFARGVQVDMGQGHIVLDGSKMTKEVYNGSQRLPPVQCEIAVDPTAMPKQMDTDALIPMNRTRWPGIYRLDGDTLTICWSTEGARPTEFKSPPGSAVFMSELRRRN